MTKTFKESPDSPAGMVVDNKTTRMVGNQDNFVMTDDKGVWVGGPVSFISGSAQTRWGGLWTMNNELAMSLPSTMATPTQVMNIDPPLKQFESLMADAAIWIGLIGSLQALG